jgi:hypothetical protein
VTALLCFLGTSLSAEDKDAEKEKYNKLLLVCTSQGKHVVQIPAAPALKYFKYTGGTNAAWWHRVTFCVTTLDPVPYNQVPLQGEGGEFAAQLGTSVLPTRLIFQHAPEKFRNTNPADIPEDAWRPTTVDERLGGKCHSYTGEDSFGDNDKNDIKVYVCLESW